MSEKESFIKLCESVRFSDDIYRCNEKPESMARLAEFGSQMRAKGVRVTGRLTPKLHDILKATYQQLQLLEEPEAYVIPDSTPNAFAPIFGIKERPLIVLTSGLVNLLKPLELQFVIGHELGHLGLGHPGVSGENHYKNELEKLRYLSISRASEISADRIGLIATRSLVIAANVKIKMASGLSSEHIVPDIQGFLEQLDRKDKGASQEWELYQLHPSLPLRLWALIQFSNTAIYARLTNQGIAGISLNEVDHMILERLNELGDGKLSEMEKNYFEMAVMWLGVALILDDEVIEEHEIKMLQALIGEELSRKAVSFAKQYGMDSVLSKLREALNRLDLHDPRIVNKIRNTYDMFRQRVNIENQLPKVYPVICSFLN